MPSPFLEMLVHVDVVPIRMADLLEAIHVELPDEGSEVMVLEVGRQRFFCEFRDVFDLE